MQASRSDLISGQSSYAMIISKTYVGGFSRGLVLPPVLRMPAFRITGTDCISHSARNRNMSSSRLKHYWSVCGSGCIKQDDGSEKPVFISRLVLVAFAKLVIFHEDQIQIFSEISHHIVRETQASTTAEPMGQAVVTE